jgi:hypothetical protein
MHGLLCRSIQIFLRDSRGPALWQAVARRAGVPEAGFEALLPVDPAVVERLLRAAAAETRLPVAALLEDMGTHLVTHPARVGLRRLLRFGGPDFAEFVHSLADLHARVALAVPELALPAIGVTERRGGRFDLVVAAGLPGFARVAAGMIRAMADDYGALVRLDLRDGADGAARMRLDIADGGHTAGRAFLLAAGGMR